MSHLLKSRSRNSAFTLVELLIVIAIIGILASLATVGVMKVLERSKMVAARIEVSQLEAAVSAAKLDLGNLDALPSRIRLAYSYSNFQSPTQLGGESASDFALRVSTWETIKKAFGKTITTPVFNWRGVGNAPSSTIPFVTLEGMEAYVFWLGGIPENGRFTGFAADRTDPTASEALKSKRKGPYYDFDTTRINGSFASGKVGYNNSYGGAYAYISNKDYDYFTMYPLNGINGIYPYRNSNNPVSNAIYTPFYTSSSYYNTKTFQIISSGQDQSFGSGGYYQPPLVIGSAGYDDLSNFSSTQLGKKDE
jgi:prepilin-type N-terminal cleavage/methylation domain-containing protein